MKILSIAIVALAAAAVVGTTAADARHRHHRHHTYHHGMMQGGGYDRGYAPPRGSARSYYQGSGPVNAAGAGNNGNSFYGNNSLSNPDNLGRVGR